ncbi:hypothetical protein [Geminisphaera colitermitum]|uniref:hypothetical protein n=1 Tax=Geminisphaera colitermitum TaxID=1148786 RepID=UPI0001965558|nr:hypothetical protein [Geminisphaera colitermitum]
MPAQIEYITMADDPAKKQTLETQWAEAVSAHTVHCPCGRPRALELAYRCLYCGVWFCASCAEAHFGKTMLEWKNEKRAERRRTFEARRVSAPLNTSDRAGEASHESHG